jgi:hypothetical protein
MKHKWLRRRSREGGRSLVELIGGVGVIMGFSDIRYENA